MAKPNETVNIRIELPKEIHKELKHLSVDKETTMREIIVKAIKKEIKEEKSEEK